MTLKFRLAIALALLTTLAGCVSTGAPRPIAGTPIVIETATLPAYVQQGQAKVVAACGYLPTARTVEALIRAYRPSYGQTLDTVDAVVSRICSAASGGQYASLNGVPIRGRFIGAAR